jgi:hypothetical protein
LTPACTALAVHVPQPVSGSAAVHQFFEFSDPAFEFVEKRVLPDLAHLGNHRAVVPEYVGALAREPVPQALTDIAVVMKDRAYVVKLVGGSDE